MGNNPNGPEQTSSQPDRIIEYPELGSIKIYENLRKNHMQIKFSRSEDQYKEWIEKVGTMKKLCMSHLLHPIGYSKQKDGLLASSSLIIDYDLYPYLLSAEINQRKKNSKNYCQKQLWLLLFYLVQASLEMRTHKHSSQGFIQPKHIFLNDQGQIKVASPLSWPDTRLETLRFSDPNFSYSAPENLDQLQPKTQFKVSQIGYHSQSTTTRINQDISDSFSIGLTLLSATNLQNYQYLYFSSSNRKPAFDEKQFIKIMNQLRKNPNYSEIFRATLCSLLELSPEKRIHQTQIQKWIQNYRTSILLKENFIVTDPPAQIVRNIQLAKNLVEYSIGLCQSVNQFK